MNGHHLKLLKELSENNSQSQRELSRRLGLSLGSVNYALSGLIDKGLIKAKRFKNSKNKRAYMYILTPAGIKKKMELSCTFLKRKMIEYEMLKMEIEELKRDVGPESLSPLPLKQGEALVTFRENRAPAEELK
ncbi:MAG: MarR family EPS-associated transcriptional regulator [Nitrospirae bacterium]|nr:MarR family EPS-associated transcriptional regulator [Nitrospirota bacterium]